MGMTIKTTIFPLRISLAKKEPWDLRIEVSNDDPKDKKVMVRIELPAEASFGTVGTTRVFEKKFEKFGALDTISLKMPVYISNYASEGSYFGKIKVSEHFNDFAYVEKTFAKEIPFRIVV